MCQLSSNEQHLLDILGDNREIKINCEKGKKQIQWLVPSYENETKATLFMYQSIPSLTIPPGETPGDSHILVAPGVGFSPASLARGPARRFA